MNFVKAEYVIGMGMAQIKVNGEIEEIKDNSTVQDILNTRKLPSFFVVELNRNIIKKEDYNKIVLKNDDVIEIAAFCAGG